MNEKYIKEFLGKSVNIGIPHWLDPDRLFYITGKITEIENNHLILLMNNGVKKISLDDVIEIEGNHE